MNRIIHFKIAHTQLPLWLRKIIGRRGERLINRWRSKRGWNPFDGE